MILLGLLGVVLIVALNAFFVIAEFSLVAVRPSRIGQLIEAGDARALVVRDLTADLNRVISGVQVGITITSLGLGIVGESTLVRILLPVFEWIPNPRALLIAHSVSIAISFLALTFLHVVLGELVPKSLALQRTENIALVIARPMLWFLTLFRPIIAALSGSSAKIVHLLGVKQTSGHALVHSAEELMILVQQAQEQGLLQSSEGKFIQGAVELGQLQVREIMVPRPDMHTLSVTATLEEVMSAFATTQRSRIPVYQGAVDQILGFVHIKDMVWTLLDRERRAEEGQPAPLFDLRRMLRDLLIVPETKLAGELLTEMRARRHNIAMVVDEFGSILGMVTLEDILEQMVGEIHDEFDVVEAPLALADGALIFDAAMNVHDLESQYHIDLPDDPAYETVGGFALSQLGFIPKGGEAFDFGGYRFTVVEMDRRRVARVKIQKVKAVVPAATTPSTATAPAAAPPQQGSSPVPTQPPHKSAE